MEYKAKKKIKNFLVKFLFRSMVGANHWLSNYQNISIHMVFKMLSNKQTDIELNIISTIFLSGIGDYFPGYFADQGPVVQKPINSNPRLKINPGVSFAFTPLPKGTAQRHHSTMQLAVEYTVSMSF